MSSIRSSKPMNTLVSKSTDTRMMKDTDSQVSKSMDTRMAKTNDSRISKSKSKSDIQIRKPPDTRASMTPSIRMSRMPNRMSEDKSSGTPSSPSSLSKTSSMSRTTFIMEKEDDITKDNVSSPLDMECTIQTERIMKILDELICKVKLVICLPLLIQDKILTNVFSEENYDELLYIYRHYKISGVNAHPIMDATALEDLRDGDISMKHRINPELGYLVYLLNSYYPKLKPSVDKIINQMKDSYLMRKSTRSFIMTLPPQPELEYLIHVEKYRELMKIRLESTAEEILKEEFRVKEMESSNAKLVAKIEECKSLLKTELISFRDTNAAKKNTIMKLEEELQQFEYFANDKLQKKILDSDRQMVLKSRTHAVRYEILQEDAQQCKENYERCLKTDMADEKAQRARRYKLETQLMSWLQKYDLKMEEKQAELDQMIEDYEKELRLTETLEEQLAEQDKEFAPLMAEREEEYHQEMARKQQQFQIEHAARVIQTAWRTVLANRNEKKKLKKQIRIMQEQRQIAERKAAAIAKRAAIAAKKAAAAEKKAKRRK